MWFLCCYKSGARLLGSPEANRCPQSNSFAKWVHYQDHCYAFDMRSDIYKVHSIEKARDICQNLGELLYVWKVIVNIHLMQLKSRNCCFLSFLTDAELLTITSKEENDFVVKSMSDYPSVASYAWLGLDFDSQGKPWNSSLFIYRENWSIKMNAH